MNVAETFQQFLKNLIIKNQSEISKRYQRITKCLNICYWDSDSKTSNSRQLGSYGRKTAINGISDLDMGFELSSELYTQYNQQSGNGQSALLQHVKNTIKNNIYPKTDIRGDGQVVVIKFSNYVIEVLPCFINTDGSYTYPNSKDGGSWKITNPVAEISEMNEANKNTNSNLKKLCKMIRAWKNKVGLSMNGLLIDTLCFNFFEQTDEYDDKSYLYFDFMCSDFFKYLSDMDSNRKYWYAPGSNQKVYKKDNFVPKAKKAYADCLEAIEKEDNVTVNNIWKTIFGRPFPAPIKKTEASTISYRNTEEFIEERFNVDIRYSLKIDSRVRRGADGMVLLSYLLSNFLKVKPNNRLEFFVKHLNVPRPYKIYWKIRNRGEEAKRRDCIRGELHIDGGNKFREEPAKFEGNHYVECYIIHNNVCVARDRIDVPITI